MQAGELCAGIISDTHGLLRPEALAALGGCDLIIHAGDIGDPEIIEALRAVTPTHAVRGNVDRGAWAAAFPATDAVSVGRHLFWVLHDIADLDLDPAAGFAAVIFGHSHQPLAEMRGGTLFLNPGSAGPRRFRLPVTVARVYVSGDTIRPEIIELMR